MKNKKAVAAVFALFAAVFYAINMPCSKILLSHIGPTVLAGLLYIGAGVGTSVIYLSKRNKIGADEKLSSADLPYTAAMVVLDVAAPVLLMFGLKITAAANASLLNNFEIVATSIIALVFFGEKISALLWGGIGLVTLSSMLLSFENISAFDFSWGSLLVLAATVCWGIENNCTRKISGKNAYEIVMVKGLCSGFCSLMIGFAVGERLPSSIYMMFALILGFIAYGLSISFYVMAQHELGAAKTSAFYASAPFVGTLISAVFLKESLGIRYFAALLLMTAGTVLIIRDTLKSR
jgi:drug/metabolite transporter (DMT)-like permease